MIISRVRFKISVSFKNKSFKIGDEADTAAIPKKILNGLVENGLVDVISYDEAEAEEVPRDFVEVPSWPLKTPIKEYLEEKPDGPNADLARKILGIS